MKVGSTLSTNRLRRGFTMTDLCVLIAVGALLFAVVVPALRINAGEQGNRIKCASNLRQIAQAALMYSSQDTRNNGKFPRTYFNIDLANQPQLYTGIDTPDAFALPSPANGPQPNDVTAGFYHLLKKSGHVEPDAFICPSSDATPLPKSFPIQNKSNFPGPEHLSYSYNNPYPTKTAVQSGWRFDTTLPPDAPFAADINPGDQGAGGPTKVTATANAEQMAGANSPNHYFDGQQVVYADCHVEWTTTPFAGRPIPGTAWRDNIYANGTNVDPTTGQGGVILGAPQHAQDSVLLPTSLDAAAGKTVTLAARTPGKGPPAGMLKYVAAGVGLLLLVAAILIVIKVIRKKPAMPYATAAAAPPQQPYQGQ